MCTLAIYRDVSDQFPLVVAANRDEFLERPADPPHPLPDVPGVVAGRDLAASGTWLGCRVEGGLLLAGLLNRRSLDTVEATVEGRRSRGLICLEALACHSVAEALAGISEDTATDYGPFNLLLADRERAVVVDNGRAREAGHAGGTPSPGSSATSGGGSGGDAGRHGGAGGDLGSALRRTELERGLSVLTNLDLNDPRCPRLASAVPGFQAVADLLAGDVSLEVLVGELRQVLGNHMSSLDPAGRNPLARVCIHGAAYGTRSASIIVVEQTGRVRYLHAGGPPCRTPFQEVLW